MVTDTSGHHLVNRENIEKEGKFAFTTDKDDIFEICFISRVPSNVRGSRQEVGTSSFTPDSLMASFWAWLPSAIPATSRIFRGICSV